MPEVPFRILLDQNVAPAVAPWLRGLKPDWEIHHVYDLNLQGKDDTIIFRWAQANNALIITFDEDFADSRYFVLGKHHGVVRLRIWPTTVELTILALDRMLASLGPDRLRESLIIIDNQKIRVRKV